MTVTVVDFPIKVTLSDIPGRLRQLADEYERGDFDGRPVTFVFVEGYEDGHVKIGCLGDCPSKWEIVGLLTLASRKFDADAGDVSRVGGS